MATTVAQMQMQSALSSCHGFSCFFICFSYVYSRQVLQEVLDTDLSNEAFPFSTHKVVNAAGHQVKTCTCRLKTFTHTPTCILFSFLKQHQQQSNTVMYAASTSWFDLSISDLSSCCTDACSDTYVRTASACLSCACVNYATPW